jgi:prepilin-type N-terminal cleavage/methylation domain-containing protein
MLTSPRPHSQSGVTLLEMVLVIILLGVLSVTGLNMISDSYTTTRIINNGNANTSNARYAMERMSREMRQVAMDTNTKLIMVTSATATQISFTKSEPSLNALVTIRLNGQSLMLSYPSPSTESVLAEHVTDFSLQYFDAGMGASPSLSQIRFVQINLTISAPDSPPVELHSVVALRNG